MITNLFLSIFAISISTSLIIIFLLVFTPFLNKRYAIKWKYLMWVIIAVRLIIPFHMDISIPKIVIDVPTQITAPIDAVNENDAGVMPSMETKPIDADNGNAIKTLPRTEQIPEKLSLLDIVAYLWMTGCLLFLSVHIFSFLHYKRRINKKGIVVEEDYILQQVCKLSGKLQIKPDISILRYKDAGSPMVIGFLKPVLVLPDCDYSKEELYFVLKHELVHIKRHDIYCKLLFVLANAVHWFNPFMYIMQKEAVVDMELSCDEKVIQQTAYAVRKAYTETLFSAFNKQHKKKTILTTQFYGGKKIMKRRFKNILATSPKKNGLLLCICAVCITLISGMLIGCSAIKNDSPEESAQTNQTAINADSEDNAAIQAGAPDDSNADIQKEAEPVKKTMSGFELTENGKSFLKKMCRQLPDFSNETDMNEEFWKSFIFGGYTASEGETVTVYREDMGFDETERKVSAEEVSRYAKLVFGKELPDIKPTLADMTESQTALYYDGGYYYIGVSDFPDFQYVYGSCEVHEDNGNTYALVTYNVNFEDTENAGTVTMRISPADNENKFVITSKVTDM